MQVVQHQTPPRCAKRQTQLAASLRSRKPNALLSCPSSTLNPRAYTLFTHAFRTEAQFHSERRSRPQPMVNASPTVSNAFPSPNLQTSLAASPHTQLSSPMLIYVSLIHPAPRSPFTPSHSHRDGVFKYHGTNLLPNFSNATSSPLAPLLMPQRILLRQGQLPVTWINPRAITQPWVRLQRCIPSVCCIGAGIIVRLKRSDSLRSAVGPVAPPFVLTVPYPSSSSFLAFGLVAEDSGVSLVERCGLGPCSW